MRKPSCITCINTCCLNPSLSWMIPLLTASQNHWRCCSNIWYYIANITIFFPFLIPLTPKDNDTFQWYWRCLWNLNIFQWSFAKWCYDLFIANERCLMFRGERQFVEFFFKWSHLHRFVISSRVDVWASFLSWQIMLSQHYPLSVRYLFEMRNWTIYNTTGNTYRSINRINKIK